LQQVTDHHLDAISRLTLKPAVIGHSFGGLIVQKIAGEGGIAATVAIDNARSAWDTAVTGVRAEVGGTGPRAPQ
jgi:pimeloyl-ACP methyl ester carboxylesterase